MRSGNETSGRGGGGGGGGASQIPCIFYIIVFVNNFWLYDKHRLNGAEIDHG